MGLDRKFKVGPIYKILSFFSLFVIISGLKSVDNNFSLLGYLIFGPFLSFYLCFYYFYKKHKFNKTIYINK